MRFNGKVALVTGAARGIGLATATRFAREGAAVMLCDLDQAEVEAATAVLREAGAQVASQVVDISDEASVERLIESTLTTWGGLDFLVNNAGITRDNLLFKMTLEEWDQVMQVHLRGTFLCTRAAQRHMVQQRSGRIVNLSSTSALGNRGQVNYSSAKAGIQAFTRAAAIELGPYGITVNAVAPGFVDTEMTRQTALRRGLDPEAYRQQRAKSIPLGRVGVPDDVARVIAFFCSEDASFVSGQILYVRGGPETQR